MAGTLVKEVMLKFVGSSGDAAEKLKKIDAEAQRLADKHPDLKVKVDSAAASAKLALLAEGTEVHRGRERQGQLQHQDVLGAALASVASGWVVGRHLRDVADAEGDARAELRHRSR